MRMSLEPIPSRRIIPLMTNSAKQLIDSFKALPEDEKHEVLAQLLRRQEYDRRENQE